MREASNNRQTTETRISTSVNLDGTGIAKISSGVGFFDHMLELFAKHSLIDVAIEADGDTHVDDHHTVEDAGIALGAAVREALGDKRGIQRYGWSVLPMDDALVTVAIDLSGRPHLVWNLTFPTEKIGAFDAELVREFFQAFAVHVGANIHVELKSGLNSHHISEAAFKALARSLRQAVEIDPRAANAVPSTKGSL